MEKTRQNRSWITLKITVADEMVDAVSNFCHEQGSRGVVLDDTRPGVTSITAYFPLEKWDTVFSRLKKYLADLHEIFSDLAAPFIETSPLQNENWAITWKAQFKSVKIGKRLMVTPPWLKPRSGKREVIIVEPAEAFGTGTHETTRGCLVLLEEALEKLAKVSDSPSLLDVGCGSGILGIAGVKMGAGPVLAVDNDPVAVEAAGKNALLNLVNEKLQLKCAPVKDLAGRYDIVIANLDPMTLAANRDKLVSLSGRFLIVSGVPLDQWDGIRNLFVSRDLVLGREIMQSEWGCGMFDKGVEIAGMA
ncbi:MAG: 50S ribosomal protein L11 methyltransferase [Desulfomonilaceae bacterium]